MNYRFSEDEFKATFNWKSAEKINPDTSRITHRQDIRFKLFPYVANGKTPTVEDMNEVIGDFIKNAVGVKSPDTDFDRLMEKVKEETDIDAEDEKYFEDIIRTRFYQNDKFTADSIGLYAYKGKSDKSSVIKLAKYFKDVFLIDAEDKKAIENAMEEYRYNALENLIIECLGSVPSENDLDKKPYFIVFEDTSQKFKKDFRFMLQNGMTSPEELADLLALYYFYYTSQTCITLDQFGNGNRNKPTQLYFALDWEKVSANRNCCVNGWKILSEKVSHIFSHAVTLELLNQTDDPANVFDYKRLSDCVEYGELDDHFVANEISKIEKIYTESVGDYKGFSSIESIEGKNETDTAMIHLFNCVNTQFLYSSRKSANQKYVNKLLDFYRSRWLKNRKRSGLVLNLTERDIIFLTKISIQGQNRIRLIDLFKEFEKRGIYLDNKSKERLQVFYTKLNLLDKKSDSGDAQYVKRIL